MSPIVYGRASLRARPINRARSQSLIMYESHTNMFDCEVKFFLDTKLIDSKNYENVPFLLRRFEVVY
jgi:hypothetical protein